MVKRAIFTLLFLVSFSTSFGGGGLLDIVITIEIKSIPVKNILELIEERTGVSFTYNPNIVDDQRIVSINIKEKTIREGLYMIFEDDVRFKEVGNHIILLKNETKEEVKAIKREKLDYIFIGTIKDARTGEVIYGASVYEVDDRNATLSDELGFYSLTIPANRSVISLYIKKKGYEEQVIVIKGDPAEQAVNDVALEPIEEDVTLLGTTDVEKIEHKVPTKAISGAYVSEETKLHGENLEEIEETRWAQISLVPSVSVGSNLSTNALINNHFSFNVLGGFSKGVRGAEIGGLFNINKEHMYGAQVGGIANLVGGDVIGAQFGGIANLVQGNVIGVQFGGISSINKRNVVGAQVSGISSITRGGFTGVQIGGIGNIAFRKSYGAQLSGIFNISKDSLAGAQVSGISNISGGGVNFMQIAGISNAAGRNFGVQIGGIFNYAKENNGLQIGLINSSKTSKGVSIGLFNWVKEGYHKTEFSANEIFPINVVFKTGSQRLYNIYNFGVRFGQTTAYAAGLGFGSYFNLGEKLMLSMDFTSQMVFENNFSKFEFAQLNKASVTIDWKIREHFTLFGGPSFNVNVMQFEGDNGNYDTNISFLPFYDSQGMNSRQLMWVGGQIGIRL